MKEPRCLGLPVTGKFYAPENGRFLTARLQLLLASPEGSIDGLVVLSKPNFGRVLCKRKRTSRDPKQIDVVSSPARGLELRHVPRKAQTGPRRGRFDAGTSRVKASATAIVRIKVRERRKAGGFCRANGICRGLSEADHVLFVLGIKYL